MDLIILAGGKGTRIKKLQNNKPKPLSIFNNINFLDYLINYYCKFNLSNIYIIAGHKGTQIYKKYNNTVRNFVSIKCIIENTPLGTGGGIYLLRKKISKIFFVVNGDSISNIDLFELLKKKKRDFQVISLAKVKKKILSEKNFCYLKTKKNNFVKFSNYSKKSYINSGIYVFDKSIFKLFKKKVISLENDILYNLIKKNKIIGFKSQDFFIDIGTPKDFLKASKLLKKEYYKPAIFLDRDNTLNYDNGYTYQIEKFKFKNHIIKLLKKVKNNYHIFIITNQAGIAHGKFKEEDFFKLHKFIKKELYKKYHIFIDDVKYCPFHPEAKIIKYRKNSKFRKPGNLMIESLFKYWLIDRKKSFVIGDSLKDMLAARKSKINFVDSNNEIFTDKHSKLII